MQPNGHRRSQTVTAEDVQRTVSSDQTQHTVSDEAVEEVNKRFADVFEPNDDIFSSRPITPGQAIDANIMDGVDTDFYRPFPAVAW